MKYILAIKENESLNVVFESNDIRETAIKLDELLKTHEEVFAKGCQDDTIFPNKKGE